MGPMGFSRNTGSGILTFLQHKFDELGYLLPKTRNSNFSLPMTHIPYPVPQGCGIRVEGNVVYN